MQATATVNYHIASPEQQAFHIDAGGVVGNLISPELVPTKILVTDAREDLEPVSFAADSVSFVKSVSAVKKFDVTIDWEKAYNSELTDLLAERAGAREVVIFDHTVRVNDPDATRKPARNVHSDYSPEGAHRRLRDLLGDEKAKTWEAGHFSFVNVWRPVGNPITNAPLGFVRPRSVAEKDWLTIKLIYPDRVGSILGLVANNAHEWVYLSDMTPDEVAFFNIYDNQGKPSIAHSALDMVCDHSAEIPRKSIESRALVRY
ncbi:hypothetical protein SADO_02715 [Salinisphaera dokdonensis CL-ES53]|uniref:Methyltransferase n=1 Tax=Salinisphaera dokdonensis CL-ES53 TaxID=1304272 RepID=A0ABV2AWV4_9GAMM